MLKIFTVQGKTEGLVLFVSLALSLGTGFVGKFLIQDPKQFYHSLILPEFAPPAYVFLPVWTILYILMGIALYRITIHDGILLGEENEVAEDIAESESFLVTEEDSEAVEPLCAYSKTKAYSLFAAQLGANFLWSIIFFRWKEQVYALLDIILLVILIVYTIKEFRRFDIMAARLLLPYLVWVLFACSLNFGIVILNHFIVTFKFY